MTDAASTVAQDEATDIYWTKLMELTCYAIQLMHYSHFKTQSLQYLKSIKC